jgi:Flp pilus assembly protein TadG
VISYQPLFEKQKRQTGQAVVELALMLPLLILILVGIFDLGRIYQAQVTLTNAAREGARYGSIYPIASAVQTRTAQEASAGGISPVTVTPAGLGASGGNPITVTVQYNFPMLTTNIFAGVSSIPIQASAVMPSQ